MDRVPFLAESTSDPQVEYTFSQITLKALFFNFQVQRITRIFQDQGCIIGITVHTVALQNGCALSGEGLKKVSL